MGSGSEDDAHRLRGAIDGEALFAIRDVFERHLPLATASVDDVANLTVVRVDVATGLRADADGRFDIQWTTEDDYKFHYTEPNLDVRWGRHPHGDTYDVPGCAHFHPPPDASSDPATVQPSRLTVDRPTLVSRAVLRNWNAARHAGLGVLNDPAYSD